MRQLNCKPGNYQCGGRCIRGNWKCKKNIKPEISKQINTSVNLINKLFPTAKPLNIIEKQQPIAQTPIKPVDNLFLSPQEAKELKDKKIKKIADNFAAEARKIKEDLEALEEELLDIGFDDSITEEEFIIAERRLNKERKKLKNRAKNLAKELIFGEIKKKNGIDDPKEVEKKLNNFKEKNKENLEKFSMEEREQIYNGIKIALENFGKIIDIDKYEIIPYNREVIGSKYDSEIAGFNNRKQIAIRPGNNVLKIVIHEFAHDIEDNFYIMKNLKKKLKEIGVKSDVEEERNDIDLNLPDDELIRKYAKRLYGIISESGEPIITGTEIITTLLELLAEEGIDIFSLVNEKGELKQQIYIVLEALL